MFSEIDGIGRDLLLLAGVFFLMICYFIVKFLILVGKRLIK